MGTQYRHTQSGTLMYSTLLPAAALSFLVFRDPKAGWWAGWVFLGTMLLCLWLFASLTVEENLLLPPEVKPGGLTFVATLNKTLKSLALAKIGAEYVLGWLPRGTHDWNRFIPPIELKKSLERAGLNILKTQGVSFDPLGWDWRLSSDVDVNYMVVAKR